MKQHKKRKQTPEVWSTVRTVAAWHQFPALSSTYTTLADQYYRSLSSDAAFNVSHKYSIVCESVMVISMS